MKKITKAIFLVCITYFISACEDKTSIDWYVNHHQEMFDKYTECLLANSWHLTPCENAKSAMFREQNDPEVRAANQLAFEKLQRQMGLRK